MTPTQQALAADLRESIADHDRKLSGETRLSEPTRECVRSGGYFAGRLPAATFAAWRIHDDGLCSPIDLPPVATLDEARDHAAPSCRHKQTFCIVATDRGGKRVAHFYRIKQGKREWRVNPETAIPGWVAPMKADKPEFSMQLTADLPVREPFRWSRGVDVVGVDRTIIEQRP